MNFRRERRGESTSRFACLSGEFDFRFDKYLRISKHGNARAFRLSVRGAYKKAVPKKIHTRQIVHTRVVYARIHVQMTYKHSNKNAYTHVYTYKRTLSFASSILFQFTDTIRDLFTCMSRYYRYHRGTLDTVDFSFFRHPHRHIITPSHWKTFTFPATEYRCNLTDLFVSGELLFFFIVSLFHHRLPLHNYQRIDSSIYVDTSINVLFSFSQSVSLFLFALSLPFSLFPLLSFSFSLLSFSLPPPSLSLSLFLSWFLHFHLASCWFVGFSKSACILGHCL